MNPHKRENSYLERNESSKLISYFPRENQPIILTLHLDFIPTTIILKFERFSIECRKTRTKRFTKANRRKEKMQKAWESQVAKLCLVSVFNSDWSRARMARVFQTSYMAK